MLRCEGVITEERTGNSGGLPTAPLAVGTLPPPFHPGRRRPSLSGAPARQHPGHDSPRRQPVAPRHAPADHQPRPHSPGRDHLTRQNWPRCLTGGSAPPAVKLGEENPTKQWHSQNGPLSPAETHGRFFRIFFTPQNQPIMQFGNLLAKVCANRQNFSAPSAPLRGVWTSEGWGNDIAGGCLCMMHCTFSGPPRDDSDNTTDVRLPSRVPALRFTDGAADDDDEWFLAPSRPVGAGPSRLRNGPTCNPVNPRADVGGRGGVACNDKLAVPDAPANDVADEHCLVYGTPYHAYLQLSKHKQINFSLLRHF